MAVIQIVKAHWRKSATIGIVMAAFATGSWAQEGPRDMARFFFSGDGRITLIGEKTEKSFSGLYRKGMGQYEREALHAICRVFGAPFEPSRMGLSLRLIEFIDYLEDHLNRGARVTITSGYRKPEYNTLLRERGGLAAKASLHQYGMAADLRIEGVDAETLWHYVRALNFGGVGYYHGDVVHIDVGPARSWDETTSGVGTGISDGNKLIGLVTDYDVYRPGMTVVLRFIRMTAFPIRVISTFSLICQKDPDTLAHCRDVIPAFNVSHKDRCLSFGNMDEMDGITWELPMDLKPGRYRIEARFCDDAWPDMPPQIQTPEFLIARYNP